MTMMRRREWLHAAAGGAVLVGARPWTAHAGQAKTPAAPKPQYPSRPAGSIEILFKAPGQSANGMQCTDEGIWTIDVAGSRTDTPGRCKVYLSSYEGKLLRELAPEGTGPSGIGVDADNKTIWIGSTYSREIIRADAKTGETIEKHFTPGAGVIYRMTTDVPAAAGHLRPIGASARDERTAAGRRAGGGGCAAGRTISDRPGGWTGRRPRRRRRRQSRSARAGHRRARDPDAERQALDRRAAGSDDLPDRPEDLDGRAHVPDRRLPPAWRRHRDAGRAATSGNPTPTWARSSSATWSPARSSDSIQLPEGSPFPHGMSVWKGYIYWTDDIGGGIAPVCRTKI